MTPRRTEDSKGHPAPVATTASGAARATATATTETATVATVRWIPTFAALVRKNVLLLLASKVSLLVVLLLPLAATGLAFGLQRIAARNYSGYNDYYYSDGDGNGNDKVENPTILLHSTTTTTTITTTATGNTQQQSIVERCQWYDVYGVEATDDCATIVFAAVTDDGDRDGNDNDETIAIANRVMESIAQRARLSFHPIRSIHNHRDDDGGNDDHDRYDYLSPAIWSGGSIVGVPDLDALGEFLVRHPGRAQTVLYFANKISIGNNNNDDDDDDNDNSNNNDTAAAPPPPPPTSPPLIYFRHNSTTGPNTYGSRENRNEESIPWELQRAFLALYLGSRNNATTTTAATATTTSMVPEINIRISKRNMFGNIVLMDDDEEEEEEEGTDESSTTTTTPQQEQDPQDDATRQRQEEQDLKELQEELVSSLFGPIFMFAIAMSTAMLSNIAAAEKTNGLIGSLRVVGMADSAYWVSWWVTTTILIIIPSCWTVIALSYALNVAFLTNVNAVAVFLALMTQYASLLAMQFCAVAVAASRPFLYALYFVTLCLSVTAVSLAPQFQAGPEDYTGRVFQYLVPGYNLGGILDSMYRYHGRFNGFNDVSVDGNGTTTATTTYEFDRLFQSFGMCNATALQMDPTNCQNIDLYDDTAKCWKYINCRDEEYIWDPTQCAPDSCYFTPMSDVSRLVLMLVQSFVFMTLAWYALQVIPSGNGLTHNPWFFCTPQYWRGTSTRQQQETEHVKQRQSRDNRSIILDGLTKVFRNQHTAVNNVDMEIENGQVFVLLGHNGAGKTTLINMLTGKMSPTTGDAYVLGLSLRENVHTIQRMTSSVPQHDLLWDDLTAAEHIRMFARIKGVTRRDMNDKVEQVLRKVHLADAAHQSAGGYSGGMKRRLSIALAGIGDPKIIMLDEPTTGIDPLNRRRIWNLVRELKRDRIVVLTTHLMQEADCLGDHITVFDNGAVQAQGTPLNLKTQYGSGYSLSIVTNVEDVVRVKALAREMMPNMELVNEAAGSLVLGVHKEELAAVPPLTRQLQSEGMLREWNISQSTIEEVFLKLASQSASMQNRQQEMQRASSGRSLQDLTLDAALPTADTEGQPIDPESDGGEGVGQDEDVFATASALGRLQLSALLRKAFILKKVHWISTVIQLAIPIALMVLAKVFFFKDMTVQPWQEAIWPQAVVDRAGVYTGFASEIGPQCTFEWKLWSAIGQDPCTSKEILTLSECAARSFESGMGSRGTDRFLFNVSAGIPGQQEFEGQDVQRAVSEAILYYLTRSSTVDTQDNADAYCDGFLDCGPCYNIPLSFQVKDLTLTQFEFEVVSYGGRESVSRCRSSYRPCTSYEYRTVLADSTVAARAAEILNTSSVVIGDVQSTGKVSQFSYQLFSPPNVDVNSRGSDYMRSCQTCPQANPLVWLAGTNAALFESSLTTIGWVIDSRIIEDDFVQALAKSRRILLENKTVFSDAPDFDTSACAGLDALNYRYGDDGIGEGFIVNPENIQPWPGRYSDDFSVDGASQNTEPICNDTSQPLQYYREMFPDGGITVTSFSFSDEVVTLDVTWEIDSDGYIYYGDGGNGDTFIPSQQSVYALYCPPDTINANGSCASGATLICAVVAPLRGCQGYLEYIPDSTFIEMTYKALWAASGYFDSSPIVEVLGETARVIYEAAVSLDELALFVFMISIAIASQAPNTASILVFEKNHRFIFAMLLNGLKLPIYWTGQYLAHLLTSGFLAAVAIFVGVILRLKPYTTQDPNVAMLLLVLFCGIHVQFGFVVLLSSTFKKERFAAVLVGFVVLTLLGASILTHLSSGNSLRREWPAVLSLIPMFGFFRCLLLVFWKRYNRELWTHVGVMLGSSTLYLIMGIYWQSVTGVGALYQLDCGLLSHICGSRASAASAGVSDDKGDDDLAEVDIANEEHRALKLEAKDTAIKIVHLGKTFPAHPRPKHAVVDVTMAMDYGEIFGLLGPNGAGKTTVISMLVGQLSPSRGNAFVAGFDTVEERRAVLSKLGIVPQFDVYYPELTVRQHLMLYAAMKGVKTSKQDSWARSVAFTVGLGSQDLFHRQASALSGGMRRRLSIAVALLSKPSCLFLDEPTTGLDPEMKRSIWNIIERMRQDRCVILTTHAMDEAEALCTRIGIMAQGSLKCIGSQKELRERYGSTYELTFTVPKGTDKANSALHKFLLKRCPSTATISSFGNTRVFTVNKSDIDLADLIEMIIEAQSKSLHTEWGVTNTSLDEVFIAITSESEGVAAGEL